MNQQTSKHLQESANLNWADFIDQAIDRGLRFDSNILREEYSSPQAFFETFLQGEILDGYHLIVSLFFSFQDQMSFLNLLKLQGGKISDRANELYSIFHQVPPQFISMSTIMEQELLLQPTNSLKLLAYDRQVGVLQTRQTNICPLKSASMRVIASGVISRVFITHIYENVGYIPIETQFEFPVDDDAAITHFSVSLTIKSLFPRFLSLFFSFCNPFAIFFLEFFFS